MWAHLLVCFILHTVSDILGNGIISCEKNPWCFPNKPPRKCFPFVITGKSPSPGQIPVVKAATVTEATEAETHLCCPPPLISQESEGDRARGATLCSERRVFKSARGAAAPIAPKSTALTTASNTGRSLRFPRIRGLSFGMGDELGPWSSFKHCVESWATVQWEFHVLQKKPAPGEFTYRSPE